MTILQSPLSRTFGSSGSQSIASLPRYYIIANWVRGGGVPERHISPVARRSLAALLCFLSLVLPGDASPTVRPATRRATTNSSTADLPGAWNSPPFTRCASEGCDQDGHPFPLHLHPSSPALACCFLLSWPAPRPSPAQAVIRLPAWFPKYHRAVCSELFFPSFGPHPPPQAQSGDFLLMGTAPPVIL